MSKHPQHCWIDPPTEVPYSEDEQHSRDPRGRSLRRGGRQKKKTTLYTFYHQRHPVWFPTNKTTPALSTATLTLWPTPKKRRFDFPRFLTTLTTNKNKTKQSQNEHRSTPSGRRVPRQEGERWVCVLHALDIGPSVTNWLGNCPINGLTFGGQLMLMLAEEVFSFRVNPTHIKSPWSLMQKDGFLTYTWATFKGEGSPEKLTTVASDSMSSSHNLDSLLIWYVFHVELF